MKTAITVGLAIAIGAALAAQERPVPKDSTRIFINGCAKGQVFTAGPRLEDQPGRSDITPGTRFRLNGPKTVINEIKAHKGTMIEVTGLIKKGQYEKGGVAIGGHVTVGAATPMNNDPTRTANFSQIIIDIEGWRPLVGSCPE